MEKKFKFGDRVYHRNLKMYGTFMGYSKSKEECNVDFETEGGTDQRCVSANWLVLAEKCKPIMTASGNPIQFDGTIVEFSR